MRIQPVVERVAGKNFGTVEMRGQTFSGVAWGRAEPIEEV